MHLQYSVHSLHLDSVWIAMQFKSGAGRQGVSVGMNVKYIPLWNWISKQLFAILEQIDSSKVNNNLFLDVDYSLLVRD